MKETRHVPGRGQRTNPFSHGEERSKRIKIRLKNDPALGDFSLSMEA